MPEYAQDEDGVVHLMSQFGDNEFTYCNRPTDSDTPEGGFIPAPSDGPATCAPCKEEVDRTRDAIKGARWRLGETLRGDGG